MRHRKKNNHLGRKTAHREAMLSNMAISLIRSKRIFTTIAKAKALRTYVEPLITKAKNDTTHSRRIVFSCLQDKKAVTELFREISVKIADRPGGYTRILKTGKRAGDSADMCYIELVDFNDTLLTTDESKTQKTEKRRRRTKKTHKTETSVLSDKKTTIAEDVEKQDDKENSPDPEQNATNDKEI